jgi:transcription factor-like protein
VITALSLGTAPLSTAPAAGCLLPFPPLGALAASPLRNVDTLLGMATTLWPIIHRLSNLLPLKKELDKALQDNAMASKVAVLRTEFETTAEAIEVALKQWEPCLPPNCSLDTEDCTKVVVEGSGDGDKAAAGKARIHSIVNNALAYRHSAFVYLYRTIYGHDRSHSLVQSHAHLSLMHCVATVSHAGPMGALLWPLFVAACEAVAADDRELTRKAFSAIDKRQGMMNIERSWDVVREVWRRADRSDGDAADMGASSFPACLGGAGGKEVDLWRSVTQDMGISVVFG